MSSFLRFEPDRKTNRIERVSVASGSVPTGETNAYLLGTDEALLVDPADRDEDLDRAIAEREVSGVAITHAHPDHVGGVAHYAETTDATVWARRGYESRFERATGVSPDRTFGEGTEIETDAGIVEVLEAPGHAPDHVAFGLENAFVVGDLAMATGSVAVAAPEGDLRAYRISLRRLHARDPERLYPAHGPVVDEPRARLTWLLDHRRERDRSVLEAVESGARTVPEITDAAYDRDLGDVRELAEGTVRAHLETLAVHGDVCWDGERAVPTN